MKNITFTPTFEVEKIFYPEPSSKNLPEWYKKTNSFMNSKKFEIVDGDINETIKKCIPVFDSLTSGYIIKTYVDVYVSLTEDGFSYFQWPMYTPIHFHIVEQAKLHPQSNGMPYPKWMNPWSIQTEKGYSCLFLPPMNNPNGFFKILPAIVDTDKFIAPVNFPFTLDDPKFEGLIPAGTPICQVIPFKRDSFSMKIGTSKNLEKIIMSKNMIRNKWYGKYKKSFWNKKIYK